MSRFLWWTIAKQNLREGKMNCEMENPFLFQVAYGSLEPFIFRGSER